MKQNAIVLTNGMLADGSAKTAHGLIRGSDRFTLLGVIDQVHAGKDAGEVLDGKHRNIPVWPTLKAALTQPVKTDVCIVGIAPVGGKLPAELKLILEECIRNGISIISGLHDFISDMEDMVLLANRYHVTITDVRKPKSRNELHFWNGKIFEVQCPIIAVLGMETNLGKRTTTRMLTEACRKEGLNAQMIFTGQTGWMQDGAYGFVLDSTINDFVAGELEHAIHTCYQETNPDLILLEGQAGLRNPSGPCGSEYLISANAKRTVLVFAPKRTYYVDDPSWGPLPSIESEIELIRMYGSEVIALALNTTGCSTEEAFGFQEKLEQQFGIPVLLPIQEGVGKLVPLLRPLVKQQQPDSSISK